MIEHLSYSSINTYLLCPKSWKFRYLDKVPTKTSANLIFGSAWHGAIENAVGREDTSTPLEALWAEAWQYQLEQPRNQDVNWGDKSQDELFELGTKMAQTPEILEVIQSLTPLVEGDQPVIEKFIELSAPGVPVPIIGYIDIITADGVPGDFKTSARKWYKNKAQDEAQPIFYLAALNQLGFDLNPKMKFRHYVFTKTKSPVVQVIETTRTVGELVALFDTITNVWRGIENNVFPCNYNTWKCSEKWCEYWSNCRGALR